MGKIHEEMALKGTIFKDAKNNVSQIVPLKTMGAKAVSTQIIPIKYCAKTNSTALKIFLHTGRSHQIRAHLQSIGHPLVGDKKYGGIEAKRQLLHAYEMILEDGRRFAAPLPKDMKEYFFGII